MKTRDMVMMGLVAEAIRRENGQQGYEKWCIMLWQIWRYVCRTKHGETTLVQKPTEANSEELWDNYQMAWSTQRQQQQIGVSCGERKWFRPDKGRYRVDVDAMFNPNENLYGVGIIIRDGEGKIRAARSKRTPPRSTTMIAEMLAVVDEIIFSIEEHLSPIEIYTDSLLTARIMANEREEQEFVPEDVADILKKARDHILIGVFHMYRTANKAAQSLAQFGATTKSELTWTENFPVWLENIVLKDIEQ